MCSHASLAAWSTSLSSCFSFLVFIPCSIYSELLYFSHLHVAKQAKLFLVSSSYQPSILLIIFMLQFESISISFQHKEQELYTSEPFTMRLMFLSQISQLMHPRTTFILFVAASHRWLIVSV